MSYDWVFAPFPADFTAEVTGDHNLTMAALGAFRHSLVAPVRHKTEAVLIIVYGGNGCLEEELVTLTLDREFSLERFIEELPRAQFPGDFAADHQLFLRREHYLEYPVRKSSHVERYCFFMSRNVREWYRAYLGVMGQYFEMLNNPRSTFGLGEQLLATSYLFDMADETVAVLGQMFSQHLLWTGQAASMRSR